MPGSAPASPLVVVTGNHRLRREKLFYKLACLVYLLVVILLFTFVIVRAFRHKYRRSSGAELDKCAALGTNWIDSVISILTLTIIVIASGIIIASFKYVFSKSYADEHLHRMQQLLPVNRVDDFIRRNSRTPSDVYQPRVPTAAPGSSPWLTTVRNQAYETHRRQSSQPPQAPPVASQI